jgi:16S rRNA (adenine1518-N6/adenine1519-N6)-dimethyltransferase
LLAGVDLATPAGVRLALDAFDLRLRGSRGQHFLIDPRVLERMVGAADLTPQDVIFEVGAGIGTLTVALARTGARVIAVEVDARFIPIARAACAAYPLVRLIHADAMRMDLDRLPVTPTKVVANLPYSIASPLLIELLLAGIASRYVVMVQREVADRIAARPDTQPYGLLSVILQAQAEASIVARVARGAFFPPPEVGSAIVRLDRPAAPPVPPALLPALIAVARAAFGQRRKMLRSALRTLGGRRLSAADVETACARAAIDSRRRGESLALDEFSRLAEAFADVEPPKIGRPKIGPPEDRAAARHHPASGGNMMQWGCGYGER